MMNATGWVSVRALAAVVADAGTAPAAATCVGFAQPMPRVEVRVRGGSVANAPTSVTFTVWRASGTSVDKIGTFTVAAADIGAPIPSIFENHESNCYVTIAFTGGASPTFTGTIEARGVSGS